MNRGSLYLCGGMQHTSPNDPLGAKWRALTSQRLRELGYTPIDIADLDRAYVDIHGDIARSFACGQLFDKAAIRHHYIHTDLKLINRHSNGLITLYDESARLGAGTISECQVAYNHQMPIFVVNAYESLDEVPGWLQALSTKIFSSFDELYGYLDSIPGGVLTHQGCDRLCTLCGNVYTMVSNVHDTCPGCVRTYDRVLESKDRYEFCLEYMEII